MFFEKIGRYAETVANRAGETRRGFLGLTGKGALSLASLVGGLLLFPGEAVAQRAKCTGACKYTCPDGSIISGGCTQDCTCNSTRRFRGMTCMLSSSNCLHASAAAPQAGTIRRAATPQAETIRIEFWDGAVQDVSNVPPGWDYEILDYDNLTIRKSADAPAE